jgi:hypothetical protein
MKKLLSILSGIAFITACSSGPGYDQSDNGSKAPDTVVADGIYGKEINPADAISVDSLELLMATGNEIENISVAGEVAEVCQAEGCWLTLKKKDGTAMRVTFNDHAYFVPKNIAGKHAVIEGKAYIETTPVEDLRHYAEDEGKSKEEIALITQPLQEIVFDAYGVMIR